METRRPQSIPDDAGKPAEDAGANHTFPSATGTIARLAYARAKAAGLLVEPLLEKANLTRSQIENPHARLSVRDQIQFLNLVADALEDEFLGFHLALVPDLREFGLLYYVMASAETLIDALMRAARYSSILNESMSPKCVDAGQVALSLRYVGVNRHVDRHQIEFGFTSIIRICRQLTGRNLVPNSVRLVHFRKNYSAELSEFFGQNIKFGTAVDEIEFSARIGNLSVVSADPYLNKLLTTYCEEALAKRSMVGHSFRTNVENTVVPLLPHGKARISEIARKLGVGERTFARRLALEGLTFSNLLEALRFSLANRYLADPHLSISEIAWLLGYSEVGAFSHAFKRWSGKTPRETRP